ncbi:MAG TPA: branched-chain amino acid ABC transporter substrate-binding protein [Gaiellaceae bacterium]|nr:branched-chain amino acid ABC transporter substrate-binding protein [Gaiellaceae bacterium]
MKARRAFWLFAFVLAVLVFAAAGCGGGNEEGGGATTGGGGAEGKTVKIVSDLPLQGSDRVQTTQMNEAIKFVLEQSNNKAGAYNVDFESFDDATAAAGKWDEAKCAENARTYVDTDDLVGVIGTYNSGCAAIEIPILNDASISMVSPANTYAGLTHQAPGTESGEPDKYYPSGKRNYVRVVASDDNQGKVAAKYMKEKLGVSKVFILDDKELYGKGVADAFEGFAPDNGLQVVGHEGWNKDDPNYRALMTKIKASGADGIYIGGVSTNNGGQLMKDKVAVVGDNDAVKVMVSDGFVLSSLFDEAGADNVNGAIGTAPTQPPSNLSGAGAKFVSDLQAKLGVTGLEVYTVYAAAAAQALVEAIKASDGTKEGVLDQLFKVSTDTVVGPMSFDENGDPASKVESVYLAKGGEWAWQETISVT